MVFHNFFLFIFSHSFLEQYRTKWLFVKFEKEQILSFISPILFVYISFYKFLCFFWFFSVIYKRWSVNSWDRKRLMVSKIFYWSPLFCSTYKCGELFLQKNPFISLSRDFGNFWSKSTFAKWWTHNVVNRYQKLN